MTSSLVGSEMCIRDRGRPPSENRGVVRASGSTGRGKDKLRRRIHQSVSYTHLTLPTICSV
eukprot:9315088-Prorocentrum_lima.AAC.1